MLRRAEISNPNHLNVTPITGNYTVIGNEDVILANATSGNITITLPSVNSGKNLHIQVKKTDSSGNTVTVQPYEASGVTIDGNSSITLSSQYATANVVCDGTNWYEPVVATGTSFSGGSISGATSITANSANALAVGPNGATNPTLQVATNVASAATGIKITGNAAGSGVALQVISSGANENYTIDAKGTGTLGINTVSTTAGLVTLGNSTSLAGALVNGALTVTSANANALAVGANGATNPVLQVNAATTSVATGLKITGAAAAAGLAVAVISSGNNENLTLDAKGTGTVTINGTATGQVTIGSSLTATVVKAASATALTVGANGSTNPVLQVNTNTSSVATGISITGAAAGAGLAIVVITSGTNENLTIDGAGTGTVGINTVSTTSGAVTIGNATSLAGLKVNGATNITAATSTSLTVGANGTTNPVFVVDASTASVVGGISVKGAASGGNINFTAITSSGNMGIIYKTASAGIHIFRPGSDGTAFQVQNAAGSTTVLNVATSTVSVTITGATTTVLVVGRQGSTNPVFQVDSSVGSVVTGIKVQGQAAGSAPVISVISTDSALGLVLQALTTTNKLTINDTLAAATNPLLVGTATDTITGGVTDAYTGGLRLTPIITAGSAQTVTRYNYMDLNAPTGSNVTITDAAVMRFNAAAGTHPAIDSGTTKTSPGTVTQWMKINVNGTIAYIPTYSSKTS